MKLLQNPFKANFIGDFLTLFAGALLPLAFAPLNFFPLAFLSPAILLACWLLVSAKRAFWRGWLFGVGFYGVGISWIYVSLHVYGNASVFFAALTTLLFVISFALYFAVQGYLYNRFFPNNNLCKIILVFPVSWVLFEWIRSWLFTGFPWLLLGYTQINTALRGLAPLFGVFGISLTVTFSAALLVAIFYFRKISLKIVFIILLVLLWLSSYALSKIHWSKPAGQTIKVSLVQGNIPQELKWQPKQIQNILATYVQLTEKNWDSDIIVWPECAIPIPDTEIKEFLQQLAEQAKQHHATLITGIPVQQEFYYYNGIITLGNGSGVYLKHHLVPFGEYLPLRAIFEIFKNNVQIPMSDFGRGAKVQPNLIANGIHIAPFICYEIIFPTEVINQLQNAKLLLLVTDDSWFGNSMALPQHLEMGQMRALETGRYLLFDSNSGITAIINAAGEIQSIAPAFTPYVLKDNVQPMTGITPFVFWGNYPIMIVTIALLTIGWFRRKTKPNYR